MKKPKHDVRLIARVKIKIDSPSMSGYENAVDAHGMTYTSPVSSHRTARNWPLASSRSLMFFSVKSVLTLPTAMYPSLRFAAFGSMDAAMDCVCANFPAFLSFLDFLPSSPSRVSASMPLRPLATRRSPRRALAVCTRTSWRGVATVFDRLAAGARTLLVVSEDARDATRMGAEMRATVVSDAIVNGSGSIRRWRAARVVVWARKIDKVPIESLSVERTRHPFQTQFQMCAIESCRFTGAVLSKPPLSKSHSKKSHD